MNTHPARLACRKPGTNPDWWTTDATHDQRTIAATLCMGCPALVACDRLRRNLGPDAAGTWAAHYQPLTDQETDTEFDAIIQAMGWATDIPTHGANIGDTGWTQLALWGPDTDARMLHTPHRRRRPRPGSGLPGSARVADGAVTQGA